MKFKYSDKWLFIHHRKKIRMTRFCKIEKKNIILSKLKVPLSTKENHALANFQSMWNLFFVHLMTKKIACHKQSKYDNVRRSILKFFELVFHFFFVCVALKIRLTSIHTKLILIKHFSFFSLANSEWKAARCSAWTYFTFLKVFILKKWSRLYFSTFSWWKNSFENIRMFV